MKKFTKSLTFFLLISSILLPILPTITVAQADVIVYKVSSSAITGSWDPANYDWYTINWGSYAAVALEYPIGLPAYYTAGAEGIPMEDEWIGILCTDWELEPWPSENNSVGFFNTGGYKSVTLTLREGVKFHDGSDWNATVFKWNIDRYYIVELNLTGKADPDGAIGRGSTVVDDYEDYFTASWNMSHYDAAQDLETTPPPVDPTITDYAYYNLGPNRSLVSYPGVDILPNGTVRNPNPYGGWDYAAGAANHWGSYGRFPHVNYVEILENPQSGGKIKVHSNSWNVGGLPSFVNYPMLSYDTYRHNYTVDRVYGYQNDVQDEHNPTMVQHMIGTGPYYYVEHDETGTPPGGYLLKNENYWNKTALEADGWFDADRLEVIKFPAGELGRDAKNTALLTHSIDYAWDSMYSPIDSDAVIANPNIEYFEQATSEYKTNIVMNSINETWWAWPTMDSWRRAFYDGAGDKVAGGVPRAMRKAMSYAFNYDLMIHTVLDDRAIRGGGVIGEPNIFYNATVGAMKATYDLATARDILLTTENDISGEVYTAMGWSNFYWPNPDLYNFSKKCADRGLTASSPDADWRWVADNDPIFVLNFYWDSAHEDIKSVLQTSLRDIGVALKDKTGITNRVTTIIWDTVKIGHLTTFDGEYSLFSCGAWVMDEHLPHNEPITNLFWAHVDPDKGEWRTLGMAGVESYHYWGNYGFNFNDDADYYYDRMVTSEPVARRKWISKMAEVQQTEVYSKIWAYEAKEGLALWKDWEPFTVPDLQGRDAPLWGSPGFPPQFLNYVGLPEEYQIIPGAPLLLTLTGSAVSMIGIIYMIRRKKKLS
jgi:ABC-type transport system substrate-binding protein